MNETAGRIEIQNRINLERGNSRRKSFIGYIQKLKVTNSRAFEWNLGKFRFTRFVTYEDRLGQIQRLKMMAELIRLIFSHGPRRLYRGEILHVFGDAGTGRKLK